jgi:hypothetical protein
MGVASAPRVSSRSRYAPTMVDHRTQNLGRGFSVSLRNPARRAGRACSGTIKCFLQVLARPPRAMMSVKPGTNVSTARGLGALGSAQPNGPFRGTRSIRSAATAAAAASDVRYFSRSCSPSRASSQIESSSSRTARAASFLGISVVGDNLEPHTRQEMRHARREPRVAASGWSRRRFSDRHASQVWIGFRDMRCVAQLSMSAWVMR